MTYWLTLASAGPEAVWAWGRGRGAAEVVAFVRGESFLLRARAVTLMVSALSAVWVYFCVWLLTRNRGASLLAALLIALSWEIGYHLRWLAPDGLLMQWAPLTLLLTLAAMRWPSRAWLVDAAAIAAALACGTKYPAGLLLILPMLAIGAAGASGKGQSPRSAMIRRALRAAMIFGVVVLVITPGMVLDRERFVHSLTSQVEAYGGGWEGFGSNVPVGWRHLRLMLGYLALDLFSPYTVVSVAVMALAAVGAWAALRGSVETRWTREAAPVRRWLAAAVVVPPALYVLYFSSQGLMFPRNALVAAPFLAVSAGLGAAWLWERCERRAARAMLVLMGAVGLAANAGFVVGAAHSIAARHPARHAQLAAAYIDNRLPMRFVASPRVIEELRRWAPGQRPNIVTDATHADAVLFFPAEAFNNYYWPANRRRLTVTWFGPYEVNFNYYSGWLGADRILLMDTDKARQIGVPLVRE